MGSQTTVQNQQYQPTSTEQQLMSNELQYSNATNQGNINNAVQAQGLQSTIMNAGQANIGSLVQGVSPGQSQNEAQMGLQGLATQFQQMGGLDSGSYAQAGANAYANTLNSNAQFNVSNLAQLLSLASGNAYQNVGMTSGNNSMLGTQAGALAGSSSSSQVFANPFSQAIDAGQAVGSIMKGAGSMGASFCWVAAELFDGWSDIRTVQTRFYLMFYAPKFFRNIYAKYGKSIAIYIHNKPLLKNMIRPLFQIFSNKGKEKLNGY